MTDKLVKQLEKSVDAQDEVKSANLIERILVAEPNNAYALVCKAVLNIHQAKFEVALNALSQVAATDEERYKNDEEFLFQRGYCLYKLQRFSEAQAVIASIQTVPAMHLAAQIAYNLEDYAAAARIYEQLLADGAARDEQERQEIITNLSAAYVTLDVKKATDAVRKADEKNADMLFNAATAELEGRQYDQAMSTIAKAEQWSIRNSHSALAAKATVEYFSTLDTLPPKGPERALFEDLSPMWVQRAYLHYAKGEEDVSQSILRPILKLKSLSVAVNAVASINWAAIKRHNDFFDTYQELKHVQTRPMLARLTTKQKLLLRYNTAMLLLNVNKLPSCKKIAEELLLEHPQSDLGPLLLLAATVRADANGIKKRTTRIDDLLAKISSKGSQTRFTIAQIRLEQGDIAGCLSELSQVEGIASRVGYLLTTSEWLIRAGEYEQATNTIVRALGKTREDKALLTNVARSLIREGASSQAAKLLEQAPSTLVKDPEIQALRVLALARSDITAAVVAAKSLPALAQSSATDEVLLASLPQRSAVEAAGYKRSGTEESAPVKVVYVRRRVLRRPPKTFNKDQRPDPERWLPMAIRPTIKDLPSRRKKELKRIRASEQADKRKAADKRKLAALAAAGSE